MFFDYGKIVGVFGKEAPVMQRRKELKIDIGREENKKLLSKGWRKTDPAGLSVIRK